MRPTRSDHARAIGDSLAALEELANRRMRLVALKRFKRKQIRVAVSQTHHEANDNLMVVEVIEK